MTFQFVFIMIVFISVGVIEFYRRYALLKGWLACLLAAELTLRHCSSGSHDWSDSLCCAPFAFNRSPRTCRSVWRQSDRSRRVVAAGVHRLHHPQQHLGLVRHAPSHRRLWPRVPRSTQYARARCVVFPPVLAIVHTPAAHCAALYSSYALVFAVCLLIKLVVDVFRGEAASGPYVIAGSKPRSEINALRDHCVCSQLCS